MNVGVATLIYPKLLNIQPVTLPGENLVPLPHSLPQQSGVKRGGSEPAVITLYNEGSVVLPFSVSHLGECHHLFLQLFFFFTGLSLPARPPMLYYDVVLSTAAAKSLREELHSLHIN